MNTYEIKQVEKNRIIMNIWWAKKVGIGCFSASVSIRVDYVAYNVQAYDQKTDLVLHFIL